MLQNKASLSWLANPEVFAVGREPAHSDHFYFASEKEMEEWKDLGTNCSTSFRQSLDGSWKFSYAENPSMRIVDFYREDYDCSEFDSITVPGHIQLQGYDRCQYINTMYPWDGQEFLRPPVVSETYNPVGSYVRFFDVDEALQGKKLYLSFQGVETAMYVWLNGQFLGYSEDAFSPKEFDIAPYVKNAGNKLAVEVYKRSSASWLEDQDFFRFSGIFREVYIYAVQNVHIRDLKITATLDDAYRDGLFTVQADIVCEEPDKEKNTRAYSVECELRGTEGKTIGLWEGLPEGEIIPDVRQWSAEFPNLYEVILRIRDEKGLMIEAVKERAGFRRFEMKDGLMRLNGKRIMFHGVNRHEFCCESGRVLSYDKMVSDVKCMKENHINAVRTSHYPNQSAWYRLCDEYGIYVIDETNLESHGSWQKMGAVEPSWNVPGNKPEWKEAVLDRAKSMYERDKNHACILIWSCGNESYAGEDILAMAEYFRGQDPHRLVHYEGCVHDRRYADCTDMESRMYAKPKEIVEYLEGNPVKPYISCEYMHAMGNSCGGLLRYQELEERYEKYQGGFIWDFVDQALLTQNENGTKTLKYGGDFDERATDYHFCGNGLLFADRSVTPKMQEVKYLFQDVLIELTKERVTLKNRFLFDDLSDCVMRVWAACEETILYEEMITDIQTPCGGLRSFEIAMDAAPANVREYTINVEIINQNPGSFVHFVREIAREQLILENENYHDSKADIKAEPLTVVEGDVNIGVIDGNTRYLFSLCEGGPVSLCVNGREHIYRAPKLSFWRALTDNDLGGKSGYDRAGWMTAGLFAKVERIEKSIESRNPFVRYHFLLPGITDGKAVISYEFDDRNLLKVTAEFTGTKELYEMPLFAVDFMLKGDYHRFRYYGKGPMECQNDREEGAFLGVYESTARENMTRNLRPQECGNRTGVRYVKVYNEKGQGLMFIADKTPFEMSVLPYSAYELENAWHQEELADSKYTWVRICACQRGVGGDDSWGAPIGELYELDSSKPVKLEFFVKELD